MVDRPIPSNLPDCDLIQVLTEKVAQRNDIKFDFIGKLNDFRERVSGDVRQINVLFPEYTPHDEEYHLSRLFHVASLILGRDRLEAMNSAELFILAISLYGHDWGMAVSETEKEFILNNNKSLDLTDLWILPDEKSRVSKFLKSQGLKLESNTNKVSIEIWREYIRQTHAFRSGERTRKYFEQIDGGVADAASRVCEGHWLDFEDLDDYHRYPQDYSVLRESVNLRALAVYLRLIDLLDLSEDRTPYVIWKFVAPRDPRSKMEWTKHRALRPITCPPYQQGRIIQVDGSTDDHDVYAALEDLKNWCDQQLRGCNDILARMNDSRHKLDIYHIDWRITPRGFKPILIQFEFNRERMFEILGDEIYQSDPYVFLRELLQNSIDAIRVRREVLKRNGIAPGEIGTIHVNVEHSQMGDAVITWEDDGIGMDDYIIRNYFAVAGKSYYHSADFEREGLNIDPISRFGIGFLSCFMVADHVEIKTFKDPYLPPSSEPLHINIPAMHRQFRVETESRESALPGTKIKVFVDGKKLNTIKNKTNAIERLDVTSYLSAIAGFVEFPIIINEGELKSIIIHPKQNPVDVIKRFGEEYTIKKVDLSFSLSTEVLPQDLATAQELIVGTSLDLSADLKLKDLEGALTLFVPNEKVIEVKRNPEHNTFILKGGTEQTVRSGSIRVNSPKPSNRYFKSRSSIHRGNFSVYRDGILISSASEPQHFQTRIIMNNGARIIVNLLNSNAEQINLARTEIIEDKENWATPIFNAFLKKVIYIPDLLMLDPVERLYKLSWISTFYGVSISELWEYFPHENWPIAILEKKNNLTILEWKDISREEILRSPKNIPLINLFKRKLLGSKESLGIIKKWNGESCLAGDFREFNTGEILNAAEEILNYPISDSYLTSEILFLKPPFENTPPLVQQILKPYNLKLDLPNREGLFEKALNQTSELTILDLHYLSKIRTLKENRYSDKNIFNNIQQFNSNQKAAFAYGFEYFNLKHPITQAIIKCVVALELANERNTMEAEKIGKIFDANADLAKGAEILYGESLRALPYQEFCRKLNTLFSLVNDFKLLNIDLKKITPTPDEFIKGTIRERNKKLELVIYYDMLQSETIYRNAKSFGRPIKG